MKTSDVVDTPDIIDEGVSQRVSQSVSRSVSQSVSQSSQSVSQSVSQSDVGEQKPNSRKYKVVRRVYSRGPYRGRQTIRQEVLKVNKPESSV